MFLLVSAAACYAAWYTGQNGHGEIAFLWLYSSVALPAGVGMFAAGQALRSHWRGRWFWQIGVFLPAIAWYGWFRFTLVPG